MKKKYNFFGKCRIFFKGLSKYFVVIIILSIITSSMSMIEPIIDANIVTNITAGTIETVIILALVLLLLRLLMQILHYANQMIFTKAQQKSVLGIRMKMCAALMNVESKEMDHHPSGLFYERIRNDPKDITTVFNNIQNYMIGILTNVGIVFYTYIINPYMGLAYTIAIVILLIIQKFRIKVLMLKTRENKLISEENNSNLNELVKGLPDIKVLHLKDTFFRYVEKTYQKNYNKKMDMNRETYLYWGFYYCTMETLTFLILILGGYLVVKGNLSATGLLILWMYRSNIFSFVINTSNLAEKLKEFDIYAERMIDLLDGDEFEKEQFGTKRLKNALGKIRFDHVTFAYTDKPVLKNLDFTIEPNQNIGFVGKSGAGKSTVLNLIARLYEPQKGKVFVDEYDINDLTEDSLRNCISVIRQSPYIFNLSVKENLLLANPKLTNTRMKEICELACIDKKIESLPGQYNTVLGEGGVNLSGGEKQRLAIARALAKDTKIILLDEATSALDNTTQNYIQKSLDKIGKKKTIIVIAHRLSTIMNCDKIYVMDKGVIVDAGTHQELLQSSRIYRSLYEKENQAKE